MNKQKVSVSDIWGRPEMTSLFVGEVIEGGGSYGLSFNAKVTSFLDDLLPPQAKPHLMCNNFTEYPWICEK